MIFHTSPKEIENVYESELFGYGLFFAGTPSHHGEFVYELNEEKIKIASKFELSHSLEIEYDESIISDFAKRWEISEDDAFDVIFEDTSSYDLFEDGETAAQVGWEAQGALLKLALSAGFDGVETDDEYGTSYIVDVRVAKKHWGKK